MPKSVKGVMDEWKAGALHSGSKKGPIVKNQKQAVAIALSEQRQQAKSSGHKKVSAGYNNASNSVPRGPSTRRGK